MTAPKLRAASSGMGGQGYRIPTWLGDDGKPKLVPSVTTVTGNTAQPGITQWAVDQTAAYAVTHIDDLLSRTEEVGVGFLRYFWKPSKKTEGEMLFAAHRKALNDAAELGTKMHEYIDADVWGEWLPEIDSEQMAEMVVEWLEFKALHTIEPILNEVTVVNRDEAYAGTLDHLWRICCDHENPCIGEPGQFVTALIDAKTSRNTWPEHYEQVAALGACYEMMVEVEEGTEGAAMIELKEWGKTWWVEQPVPAFSEYRILHVRPSDYDSQGFPKAAYCRLEEVGNEDVWFESFLGSLAKKKAEVKLKEREKAWAW